MCAECQSPDVVYSRPKSLLGWSSYSPEVQAALEEAWTAAVDTASASLEHLVASYRGYWAGHRG
jgi:hypothetical protein